MPRRITTSTRRTSSNSRAPRRAPVHAARRECCDSVLSFLLRRVALIVPTFIGVTLLAFALIHLIPGDPVENLSGERGMDPARRARLLHEFGLDRPLTVQYLDYIKQVVHGDLGISLTTHEPVL